MLRLIIAQIIRCHNNEMVTAVDSYIHREEVLFVCLFFYSPCVILAARKQSNGKHLPFRTTLTFNNFVRAAWWMLLLEDIMMPVVSWLITLFRNRVTRIRLLGLGLDTKYVVKYNKKALLVLQNTFCDITLRLTIDTISYDKYQKFLSSCMDSLEWMNDSEWMNEKVKTKTH